jgi:acetyltransferase-like isoleucine patch superfamily enzyme
VSRLKRALARLRADFRLALFHAMANVLAGSAFIPRDLRRILLRGLGMNLGAVNIYPHSTFKTARLTVGRGTIINQGCRFDNVAKVTIGRDVAIGPEVFFGTTTHVLNGPKARAGKVTSASISIGDGCWIGARSVILPGVSIESGTIVAAGAVVTKSLPGNALYGGTPARKIRELSPAEPTHRCPDRTFHEDR